MKSKKEIAAQFKKHKKISMDGLARQYRNTEDTDAFYAGDLMDYWIGQQTQDQFGVKKRAMVQINKVKPFVNAVKGFMAQNRRVPKYSARITGDKMQQMYSDYANGMATFIRSRTYADQKETKQDGDMLTCGYGAIETAMTYSQGQSTTDPNGQVVMGNLDTKKVAWDPFARDTNLLDARWEFYEQIYDMDDALQLYQDSDEDDFEAAGEGDLDDGDGDYKFYSRGGKYNKIRESSVEWSDSKKEKVKVYFYQWYDYETFYRCDNPAFKVQNPHAVAMLMANLEAIAQEFPQQDDDQFAFDPKSHILNFDADIKKALLKAMPGLQVYEYKRKVYYSAVISKDHVFTAYKSISQRGFTVKFKTGDFDAKNKIWVGMVNSMKEPSLYYNKALTELMFIIGCNSKGGVLVEEDAVDDIQKFELQWAKTDAVVIVESGALQAGKIQPKKQPYSVTGYENIVTTVGKDIQDVTGIDRSFLGSSENKQENATLNRQRIRQVCSSLACYFDAITLYQFENAYLLQDFMYTYAENNDGSLFSVQGQNGKLQFLKIARDKLVAEYDVILQEAPTAPEEKQEYATILTSVAEKLAAIDPSTAKMILAISIKYLPLEDTDQQMIMQALMPQQGQVSPQQVQQLQQQIKQLTQPAVQAQISEVQSKAMLNQAKARLEVAKIPEIASQILKNKAAATHDLHEGLMDEAMTHHEITKPDVTVQT